jgi:hypothetical protein
MSDNLSSSDPSEGSCSDVALGMSLVVAAPCILFLMNVYDVIVTVIALLAIAVSAILTLVKLTLVAAPTSIDLFHSALIVVVFIVARPGNLSVFGYLSTLDKLIRWFWCPLADDNGLRLFPDNNGLGCRRCLRGFVANVDGLRLELGLGRLLKVFNVPWIPLEFILLLPRRSVFFVAFVVPRDANLGSCWRWWALHSALDVVLADFAVLRRGRTVDITILTDLATGGRWIVSLYNVLFRGSALFVVVAPAVDEFHVRLVGIFLQAVVRDFIAAHSGITAAAASAASASSSRRAGLPVALALALGPLVNDRHGEQHNVQQRKVGLVSRWKAGCRRDSE